MAETSPSRGMLSRIFGSKPKDIELPNESGRTDKRLKKKKNEMPKLSTIMEGYKRARELGKAK